MEDTKINFNNDDNSMFGSGVGDFDDGMSDFKEEEEIPEQKEELKDFEDDSFDNDLKKIQDNINELGIVAPEFEEETKSITSTSSEENLDHDSEIEQWQENAQDDDVVKKYIVYISKDYVKYIDSLSLDARSAYINDALEMKIKSEKEKEVNRKKKKMLAHLVVAFLTFCIAMPVALYISHKAIMATFENYKYSQDNFEKLYRQKFEKDRTYMRSLEYNKMLENRLKKMNAN